MDADDDAQRAELEQYFTDASFVGDHVEHRSPSGRYRLEVRRYSSGPHTWKLTRGTVTRVSDGTTICDIKRNLSAFHHSFIVKDGREWLIAGRSYTSQTIVDLDRAIEYEPPGPRYDGGAFCWIESRLSPDERTLAVEGCIWASAGEIRFFDFTDPARGWPPLPVIGNELLAEDRIHSYESGWLDARTFECRLFDRDGALQERTRAERRGDEMVVTEHWLSPEQRARREARSEEA